MPSLTLLAPTTWNAKDPVDQLAPNEARWLQNVFITEGVCCLMNAPSVASTAAGAAFRAIFEHNDPDGTITLIGTTSNKIYDVSAASASNITGTTTPTTGYWQGHQINGKLILVNGANQPQQIDKTSVSDAGFTGVSDDAALIQGCTYKSRQYFVEKDSQSLWYSDINAVTGALTEFPVGAYLNRGGPLWWVTTFAGAAGALSQDVLVICSANGELLLYAGNYPGDQWQLVGRYGIGRPMGRVGYGHTDGDLLVMTSGGIESLSALMAKDPSLNPAEKINPAYLTTLMVNSTETTETQAGWGTWCVAKYPKRGWLVFGVPLASDYPYRQFIYNYKEKTWSLASGWPFGTVTLGGRICSAKNALYYGTTDSCYICDSAAPSGADQYALVYWSESYFNKPELTKTFSRATFRVMSTGVLSLAAFMSGDFRGRGASEVWTPVYTSVTGGVYTDTTLAKAKSIITGLSGSAGSASLAAKMYLTSGVYARQPGPAAIRNVKIDFEYGGRV